MGALLTPPAVAMIVADLGCGLLEKGVPLQTTKVESQTPAQTEPSPLIVTKLGLEELKVMVGAGETAVLFAFSA
jgi:hypothetical protein